MPRFLPALYCLLLAGPLYAQAGNHADSAFHALQERGRLTMGVDQYTSTHRFEPLPNGGRIIFESTPGDTAATAMIRRHLQEITRDFSAGDFGDPHAVHAMAVPGTATMADRRDRIVYQYYELPHGGEVRIISSDPAAVGAVHEFLAFQRSDHRAGH